MASYIYGLSNRLAGYDPDDDGSTTPPPTPSPVSNAPPRFPITATQEHIGEIKKKSKCDMCGADFANKFNRDRHGKMCAGKKALQPKIKNEEEEKVVEVKKSGMKCLLSDKPIEGKLIIPCTVHFKN